MREAHITVPRQARYYSLAGEGDCRVLCLICHGYGQLANAILRPFEGRVLPGQLLVAPEGLSRYYVDPIPHGPRARVGASWMTREDRESEIEDYIGYLNLLTSEIKKMEPNARVDAVGFSQGVATAARWAASGSMSVDRLILWEGTIPPDADLAAAQARRAIGQIHLVWGSRDELVNAGVAAAEQRKLVERGVKFVAHQFEGGHGLDPDLLQRLLS
jgi:predicted esterase